MPSDCPNVIPECKPEPKTNTDKFLRHFISGAVAGALSRTITAPIDRIKIFCQVSNKQEHMLTLVSYMIKEGGLRSLWRGNLINVLKTTPKSSIRFAFYDYLKLHIKTDDKGLVLKERILAGSIAGFISQTLCFPLEVLKTRISLSYTGQYTGITDALVTIYKTEGIKSFGRGYIPTLIAIIPHSGLDLAGYETFKDITLEIKQDKHLNNFELFILSSLSCMIGQVVTYPLALVCTRMQASGVKCGKWMTFSTQCHQLATILNQPVNRSKGCEISEYQHKAVLFPGHNMTTRKMFSDIIKYEGFFGLYRGLIPTMIKFIPVVGITFVTYEHINKHLGISMT